MKSKLILGISLTASVVAVTVLALQRSGPTETLTVKMYGRLVGSEAQLFWIPETGWTPDQGLKLVILDGGRENVKDVIPTDKARTSELWRTASLLRSKPQAVDTRPVESSKAAFGVAQKAANEAVAEKRGSPELVLQRKLMDKPEIRRLSRPIGPGGASSLRTAPGGAPRTAPGNPAARLSGPVDDDAIEAARETLRASAALDLQVGIELGLRVGVGPVSPGTRFELRTADGTVVGKISVADFKGPPPMPNVESPVQLGQFKVGLNFSIPGDQSEYGVVTYNLYRIVGGRTSQLNMKDGERVPILATFDETTDGKLVSKLFTSVDDTAPIGAVEYRVEALDCFGATGPQGRTGITVEDVAVPYGTPTFVAQGPIDTGKLPEANVPQGEARIYWTPQQLADDEVDKAGKRLPNVEQSSFTYQVERIDHEDDKAKPVTLSAAPEVGRPADLQKMTLATLLKLRPRLSQVVELWNANSIVVDIESSSAQGFFDRLRQQGTGLDKGTIPLSDLQLTGLFELSDKTPQDDRYFRYRLTCRLERSKRFGESTETSPIGIPAAVLPKAPTSIQLSDRLAGVSVADFATIKGARSNVLSMQAAPGLSGPAGLINPQVRNSRLRGAEMLGARQAALATRAFGGAASARLGSGVQNPLASPTAKSLPTGSPANYGRIVTILWQAPIYATPVTYRVYRAVGTGIRTQTGLPTPVKMRSDSGRDINPSKMTIKPVLNAPRLTSERMSASPTIRPNRPGTVGRPSPTAGLAAQKMQFVRGLTLAQRGVAFADEFEPHDSEYTLVGETAAGETSFTDVIPRSQSTAYFYRVEPVNRWGSRGAKSVPTKKRMDPSLTPSAPKMESVKPTENQSVEIVLNPNVREEDVKVYEIYRVEGRLAVPPPVPPAPAPGPVRVRPAYQFRANQIQAAPRKNAPAVAAQLDSPQAPKTQSGRDLAASNANAVGSAQRELGVASIDSPASSIADAQRAGSAQLTPEVKFMMEPANYTKVYTITVNPSDPGPFIWEDKTVDGGKSYIYRVVAINTANLKSTESPLLDATVFKTSVPKPSLVGTPSATDSAVTLNLQVGPRDGVKAFIVRRQVGAKPFRSLGTFQAAANSAPTAIQDVAVRSGMTYSYEIRALDYAGNVSAPLDVSVTTP